MAADGGTAGVNHLGWDGIDKEYHLLAQDYSELVAKAKDKLVSA